MANATALEALYAAVYQRLTGQPEVWTTVSPDVAPTSTRRPHVVYAWTGGGERNGLVRQDAELVLAVQAYCDTQAQAFVAAGRISALLNDADAGSALALDGGADWSVLNSQQEGVIHRIERVDGQWVYREGHYFRFMLEHT